MADVNNFTPLDLPIVEKHAGGRPTSMTEEVLAKLEQGFMIGFSDREACAFAKINPATLYRYQEEHPEFCEQKEIWKEHTILKAKTTLYKNLDDKETAKWYLERKMRKEFATRQDVTSDDQKLDVMHIYKPEKNTE